MEMSQLQSQMFSLGNDEINNKRIVILDIGQSYTQQKKKSNWMIMLLCISLIH